MFLNAFLLAFRVLFADGKVETHLNLVSLSGFVSVYCLGYVRKEKFAQKNVFLYHADSH